MPVGAIGAYLLGLGARERFAAAAAAALGVASVDGAYALVASLGGAGLHAALASGLGGAHRAGRAGAGRPGRGRTLQQAVRRYRAGRRPRRVPRRRAEPAARVPALVGLTAVNPATVITSRRWCSAGRRPTAGSSWPAVAALRRGRLRRLGGLAAAAGRRRVRCSAGCCRAGAGSWASRSPRRCSCSGWPSPCLRLSLGSSKALDELGPSQARAQISGSVHGSVAEQLLGRGQQHAGGQPVDGGRHVVGRGEARSDPDVAVPRVPPVREGRPGRRSSRCPPPWPGRPPGSRCRRPRRG